MGFIPEGERQRAVYSLAAQITSPGQRRTVLFAFEIASEPLSSGWGTLWAAARNQEML